MRLLRVLRPLRVLSHDENFKVILSALLTAILPLAQVIFVTFLIYLIFSIFAMSFLAGTMGYCDGIGDYYGVSITEVVF